MTEPEDLEEDLFADLYDADESASKPQQAAKVEIPEPSVAPAPAHNGYDLNHIQSEAPQEITQDDHTNSNYPHGQDGDSAMNWSNGQTDRTHTNRYEDGPSEPHGIGIKEDGKMFIGGLNWETTDESLKDYFSKFGEVQECTVMRDGPSGRSRGFGFLTFKDPRTVNVVMVKEHFLDGKIVRALISTSPNAPGRQQQPFSRPFSHPPIRSQDPQHERELTNLKIDPKRAIPRDEQERTSKIFVGGVSQEANEQDFKDYFSQFGRVIDATLMIDKITHRPRGFGFVTFDSEAAVELTLQGDLMLKDKPIEVKKAQPRGNMREEEDMNDRRGGRRGGGGGGGGGGKDFNDRGNYDNGANQNQGQGGQQYPQGPAMTPQMMAQYWTKMQQYFAVAQQQMAAMQGSAMNPAMMAQMQQYKQMQAMQAMQAQMAQQQQQPQRGSASPMPPQSPGAQGGMNPMMMQQMQQMQAMAAQGGGYGMSMSPQGFNPGSGGGGGGGVGSPHHPPGSRGTPGYNAQDQLAFEQQKYEQQQARRAQQEAQQMQSYAQGGGGPTSWEGMYDDVPQPGGQGGYGGRGGGRGGGGGGGGGGGFQKTTPGPQSAPPANAPTGPKNAGKPGANYRGGAGGRGGHRGGYHPYAR